MLPNGLKLLQMFQAAQMKEESYMQNMTLMNKTNKKLSIVSGHVIGNEILQKVNLGLVIMQLLEED